MDLLKKMNDVVEYIEDNITNDELDYQVLADMLYCSKYEFFRIFNFIAGVSVSEYISKRRLSLAVFDIQNGDNRIIDIAMKYCYDSDSSFSRTFKAMHNVSPAMARKQGIMLKTYPKLTFTLTVKGAEQMEFRIEKKDGFKIIGLKGYHSETPANENTELDLLWDEFLDNPGDVNRTLRDEGYYSEPLWQVGAYKSIKTDKGVECIIGAELKDKKTLEGMDIVEIPEATYAVFSFYGPTGSKVHEAITRIVTEWLPTSNYKRDMSKCMLDSYSSGVIDENYKWEIWFPVLKE